MIRINKKTKYYIIGLLVITLIALYSNSVLIPAYNSVAFVCDEEARNELEKDGWVAVGTTTTEYDKETQEVSNITITISDYIDVDSEYYQKVYKHEYCHKVQSERGFPLKYCSTPIQKYLSEVECYTVEHFPNKLYNFLY